MDKMMNGGGHVPPPSRRRRPLINCSVTAMEFFSCGPKRALTSCCRATEREREEEVGNNILSPSGQCKRALLINCCSSSSSPTTEIDGREAEKSLSSSPEEDNMVMKTALLPEDMVEKIVAMMPFPSIFKARGLSKSWLARFSPISTTTSSSKSLKEEEEDGEEKEKKKRLATSFQKCVSEWSNKWATFCPAFIGREDIIAYDHASQNWRRLASLSFLPESMFLASRNSFLARSYYQLEGALLYGFARTEVGFYQYEMYVANIWTRSWKQLLPRPKAGLSFVLCSKLVCDVASDFYNVILFCQDDCLGDFDQYSAQIYDSKSEGWSTQKFVVASEFSVSVGPSTCAYLNGVLYMVAVSNPQNLLAFNLAEGTLEEILLESDERMEIVGVDLLVCNANRLVMVTRGVHPENMQVLKVDLQSKLLLQLSRGGPPAHVYSGKISPQPVSDGKGNCVFFRVEDSGTLLLSYNVDEREWSSFPIPSAASADYRRYRWIGSSCHPGLNPFVAV